MSSFDRIGDLVMVSGWRGGFAGLVGVGLVMTLSPAPVSADDVPEIQHQLRQLQDQLNSQRDEINRLRGELERTRQAEAARKQRLRYANPALDGAEGSGGGGGAAKPEKEGGASKT